MSHWLPIWEVQGSHGQKVPCAHTAAYSTEMAVPPSGLHRDITGGIFSNNSGLPLQGFCSNWPMKCTTHLKYYISLIAVVLNAFFFFAMPSGLWDLSSLTRDWTRALSSENAESKLLEQQGLVTGGLLSNLYQSQKKQSCLNIRHIPFLMTVRNNRLAFLQHFMV